MEVQSNQKFLPLQVAAKYYKKWECDTACLLENSIYCKCLSGNGSVEFINGNTYIGLFKNGLMNGIGVYKWKSGLVYEGQFNNNAVTGQGKLTWPDGSYYVGGVCDGKRQGNGQHFCATDKSNYKGEWKNGLKHGKGILTFSNSSVYEGQFISGFREGVGRMKYPSGNDYEGEWKGDKKEGKGVMNWYTTYQKYDGSWKDDQPNGNGTYFWFEGRNESRNIKTAFKGHWKAGKRDGFGAFFYNNGCRLEGYFISNLKEGLCFLLDQFGDGHLQLFKGDKSMSKKQEIAIKGQKKSFRLPEITHPSKQNTLHNNEPTQNNYPKFIDIESPLIDDSIFNLLLRQNSQLRQWYKTIVSNVNKEIFNGLNIEQLWRLVRDLKLTDQYITIAKLNRQFYKGFKSHYEIQLPNKQKLELAKQHPDLLTSHNYDTIEWQVYFTAIQKQQLNWENWKWNGSGSSIDSISLSRPINIHNQNHVILFRHFVMYIMHLTLLQYQQQRNKGFTFRKCLQELLGMIKTVVNPVVSLKSEKVCSQNMTNVGNHQKLHISEECSALNHSLFDLLNEQRGQLLNVIDQTITVKQLYCLLTLCQLLRQPAQKMLFLEKIERNMSIRTSLLRKQNKNSYPLLEKLALTSPYLSHIMNYEMVESEFDEIIYILLNRKIGNTQSKEEFVKRYREIIRLIKNQVVRVRDEAKSNCKTVGLNRKRVSLKDRQKEQLQRKIQQQKRRKVVEELKMKQLMRQQKERLLMKREDTDVGEEESLQSEEYYD